MSRASWWASYPCTPWVQNVHWLADQGVFALAQNQIVGLRWRVTFLHGWSRQAFEQAWAVDFELPADELEGMSMVGPTRGILMSSSRQSKRSGVHAAARGA